MKDAWRRFESPPIAVNASSHVSLELHVHIDGAEVHDLLEQALVALKVNSPAHHLPSARQGITLCRVPFFSDRGRVHQVQGC